MSEPLDDSESDDGQLVERIVLNPPVLAPLPESLRREAVEALTALLLAHLARAGAGRDP